jgi:hypothetical protein
MSLISSRSKDSFSTSVYARSEVYNFVAEEWMRHETHHPPQTTANIKNVWSYTSIPSCFCDETFNKEQRYPYRYSLTPSD